MMNAAQKKRIEQRIADGAALELELAGPAAELEVRGPGSSKQLEGAIAQDTLPRTRLRDLRQRAGEWHHTVRADLAEIDPRLHEAFGDDDPAADVPVYPAEQAYREQADLRRFVEAKINRLRVPLDGHDTAAREGLPEEVSEPE